MTKVHIAEIDRDFLAVTGLWPQLMHILGHPDTIHMPSVWMSYGCSPVACQEAATTGCAIVRGEMTLFPRRRVDSGVVNDPPPAPYGPPPGGGIRLPSMFGKRLVVPRAADVDAHPPGATALFRAPKVRHLPI